MPGQSLTILGIIRYLPAVAAWTRTLAPADAMGHAPVAPGDPPAARLKRGETLAVAQLVRAASGAKYEAQPGIVFWTRGDEALVEWPGVDRFNCERRL